MQIDVKSLNLPNKELMLRMAFFLSSSLSIGSTAQQGRLVNVYSNLAYLQNPQALHKNGSFSS